MRIKICGITSLEDAKAVVHLGADALGFVFAESARRISPEEARSIVNQLPPFVAKVGVFVNAPLTHLRRIRDYCGLDAVQLHGEEDADYIQTLGPGVIKALRLNGKPLGELPKSTLLVDAYDPKLRGGTGKQCDWQLASELAQSRLVILAGGLSPDNVAQAINKVNPYAVDVSSGVEREPGRKDHDKIASFINNARNAASIAD